MDRARRTVWSLIGGSAMMPAAHGNGARRRLLAAGDIGSTSAYHVGDESMMLGLIEGVAASGVDVQWTLMSAQPERSAERFGVSAVHETDVRRLRRSRRP